MRSLLVAATLALAVPASAQGVLGADGIYVLAETAPAPQGGMAAITDALSYPEAALEAGAKGTVVLMLVVAPDGTLAEAEVGRAPHPALGEAALEAVSSLAFTPGTVGGEPVPTRLSLPVRFELPTSWADQPASPLGGWDRVFEAVQWPARVLSPSITIDVTAIAEVAPDGTVEAADVVNLKVNGQRVRTVQRVVTIEEARALSGTSVNARLIDNDDLREAILDAILAARYVPAIRDGEAVRGRSEVVVTLTPTTSE